MSLEEDEGYLPRQRRDGSTHVATPEAFHITMKESIRVMSMLDVEYTTRVQFVVVAEEEARMSASSL